ncbi:MAG: nucleotidyltransferase [Phenylobacterium sp.]
MQNAEHMVREAIRSDEKLEGKSIDIFGQGSYANNTNVRQNSDIDINVCLKDVFYFELPQGLSEEDAGINHLSKSIYSYPDFKNDVEVALVNKFGRNDIIRKNKCITIKGNSYRNETDVVPTCDYRRYKGYNNYVSGIKFLSDQGDWIVNFPKQHIKNGIIKNDETSRRFKRLTRLLRKIRYLMIEEGIDVSDNITSFLLECLLWNVPNEIINHFDTWQDRLIYSIAYIYKHTKSHLECENWMEISELLYLFKGRRKWSFNDVNNYMSSLLRYLDV